MLWNFSNPLNAAILHWYSRVKTFGNDLGNHALLVGFQLLNLSLDIGNECINLSTFFIENLHDLQLLVDRNSQKWQRGKLVLGEMCNSGFVANQRNISLRFGHHQTIS